MEEYNNAGPVMRYEGLSDRKEFVDCTWCKERVETRLERVAGQRTR